MVEATGHIPDALIEAFEKGISIEDVYYKAQLIERLDSRAIRVVLVEGKNREIRRVFSHFHLHPFRLRRVRIGPVKLEDLEEGKARPLRKFEIEALLKGNREQGTGNRNNCSQSERVGNSHNSRTNLPSPRSPFPSPQRSMTW